MQDIRARENRTQKDFPLEGIIFLFSAFLVLSFCSGFFLLQYKNLRLRLSQNIKKHKYIKHPVWLLKISCICQAEGRETTRPLLLCWQWPLFPVWGMSIHLLFGCRWSGGDFLLLKEALLSNRRAEICGSLCFQKKLMDWKSWRYNLIFSDLEAGMRSTEIHFCFSVGASKHHHFLGMGSRYFLTEFPSLSSL